MRTKNQYVNKNNSIQKLKFLKINFQQIQNKKILKINLVIVEIDNLHLTIQKILK